MRGRAPILVRGPYHEHPALTIRIGVQQTGLSFQKLVVRDDDAAFGSPRVLRAPTTAALDYCERAIPSKSRPSRFGVNTHHLTHQIFADHCVKPAPTRPSSSGAYQYLVLDIVEQVIRKFAFAQRDHSTASKRYTLCTLPPSMMSSNHGGGAHQSLALGDQVALRLSELELPHGRPRNAALKRKVVPRVPLDAQRVADICQGRGPLSWERRNHSSLGFTILMP